MYIVVETDGAYSDKDWAVRGLFKDIREASKYAWNSLLIPNSREYCAKYWCDPSKKAEKRRIECGGYGVQYHILEWNMQTNMHAGTWYLDVKPFFLELGKRGEQEYYSTIHKFLSALETYVPGKLWHECMTYEKLEDI